MEATEVTASQMSPQPPTLQELDAFFAELDGLDLDYFMEELDAEWDLWVEEGGDASMEQAAAEAEDQGWRQWDFL